METRALKMIRLMLDATRQGRIKWRKTDYDRWAATVDNQEFVVEFIFLARTDDVGSDRTIARLRGFQLLFDYSIGTEGMDLICQMLSVGDRNWTDARARGERQLANGIAFLQGLKRRRRKNASPAVPGGRKPRLRS